ncbi:MAG: NAD(P)-dependent oxidoreductase, partial [Acidimicrobiales bacterium]
PTPPRVAFCGLGQMGAPMAARLVDVSDLAVWNRTAERAALLVEQGARPAATPAEAAEGAGVVFTMLSNPDAVEEVVFGDHGVAAALGNGATLVEMSTIGPAAVARIRDRLPPAAHLVDAPVLGSVPQATSGELKVFAGGEAADIDRVRPVLERLGTIRHVGALGAGAAMKLVANAILGVLMTGLGEALTLADALGLDQHDVLDVLSESPIGVTTRSKRANIESGTWPANFKLSLAAKDLGLVMDAATAAGLDVRLLPEARAWLVAALDGPDGPDGPETAGLDYSVVIDTIRRSSGS